MGYLNFVAEVYDGKPEQNKDGSIKLIGGKVIYNIINNKQEHLGYLEKVRVGQWMSWCLFLNKDCYMSASCLDEVREKIKSLNTNKVKTLG